tara:strand:- start:3 stop:743 length:741 start_codon:yes stop_codon:yes gene_type:complete
MIYDGYLMIESDERIKENITDVSDNLALELVRNIPCRYYEYKNKTVRGEGKTVGFIAQEVDSIFPMAVSKTTQFIPNEMRDLDNISWEYDNSLNKYKLSSDLEDISGVKYKFYVFNDLSDNNQERKEIIGNHDNTFSFDTSWNYVFCYGKEVNDFHTLDKQKLFALNFSATQEIDRQQQSDKLKIATLENKSIELENKSIELENKNTELENKNTELENENKLLKDRVEMLEMQMANILQRLNDSGI